MVRRRISRLALVTSRQLFEIIRFIFLLLLPPLPSSVLLMKFTDQIVLISFESSDSASFPSLSFFCFLMVPLSPLVFGLSPSSILFFSFVSLSTLLPHENKSFHLCLHIIQFERDQHQLCFEEENNIQRVCDEVNEISLQSNDKMVQKND
jgi:hypothetical protein